MSSQEATSIFTSLIEEHAGSEHVESLTSLLEEQIENLTTKDNWRATVVIKSLKKSFRELTGQKFPFDERVKDLSKVLHAIHEEKFGKSERPARGGAGRPARGHGGPMVLMTVPPSMVQAVLQLGGRVTRSSHRGRARRPRLTINRHKATTKEPADGSTTPSYDISDSEAEEC